MTEGGRQGGTHSDFAVSDKRWQVAAGKVEDWLLNRDTVGWLWRIMDGSESPGTGVTGQ